MRKGTPAHYRRAAERLIDGAPGFSVTDVQSEIEHVADELVAALAEKETTPTAKDWLADQRRVVAAIETAVTELAGLPLDVRRNWMALLQRIAVGHTPTETADTPTPCIATEALRALADQSALAALGWTGRMIVGAYEAEVPAPAGRGDAVTKLGFNVSVYLAQAMAVLSVQIHGRSGTVGTRGGKFSTACATIYMTATGTMLPTGSLMDGVTKALTWVDVVAEKMPPGTELHQALRQDFDRLYAPRAIGIARPSTPIECPPATLD